MKKYSVNMALGQIEEDAEESRQSILAALSARGIGDSHQKLVPQNPSNSRRDVYLKEMLHITEDDESGNENMSANDSRNGSNVQDLMKNKSRGVGILSKCYMKRSFVRKSLKSV